MGWTSEAKYVEGSAKKQAVKNILDWKEEDRGCEVLKLCQRGSVFYAAIRHYNKSANEDRVFGAVILTRVDSRHYFNFYHKEMDESMGPNYYDAPESLLALLTPTNSEWANEWRQKCRERAEARKKERSSVYKIRKLPEGTYIKVDYQEGRLLQVCKYMGKRAYIDWTIRRRMSSNLIARHNWEVVK